MVEGVPDVKWGIEKFFYDKFKDHHIPRPGLDKIEFKRLSVKEKEGLEEMFSREEIREVIFGCEGDRSPGSGGLNMEFINRC